MWFSALARRAALLSLCALLLAAGLGAQAQAGWFVYLLDSGGQALVRVGADGSQAVLPLGINPNAYLSAFDIGFSPDGARAALCAIDYGSAEAAPSAVLTVRDLAAQTDLMRLDLGPALGCRAAYRADGAFIALGIVHYLPGDVQAVPDLPAWELRVIDPVSGGTIAQLTSDSPEAAAAGLPSNPPVLPVVRRFDGAELIFAAQPFATGGGSEAPALNWRIDTATLAPLAGWGYLQFDLLANGELAWTAADSSRPAGEPPGPLPADNVVRWQDASGQARTIYASPDWLLIGARFIDEGARLALQLVAPYSAEYPAELGYPTRWIALDRAGATGELTSTAGYAQLRGVPGGYVVLQVFTPEGGGAPTYTLDYNAGGQIRTLWATQAGAAAYDLAWAPPMTPAAGLPPFAALP